jgi:hypothetical protein
MWERPTRSKLTSSTAARTAASLRITTSEDGETMRVASAGTGPYRPATLAINPHSELRP